MINSLKNKIKFFVDRKVKDVKNHQNKTQQVALDYAQISKLFPESTFIPLTRWSISPSAILHILNDIVLNERRHIIEFGSGASTLYIARLIQTMKLDAKFYSVESNEDWLMKMREELSIYELQDIVTFIYAPLKEVTANICFQEQKIWYDPEKITQAIKEESKLDLVIVDGPFGGSGPYARYSALPFLKPYLTHNFAVFLDDINRQDEKIITAEWQKILGLTPQSNSRYAYFTNDTLVGTVPYKVSKL